MFNIENKIEKKKQQQKYVLLILICLLTELIDYLNQTTTNENVKFRHFLVLFFNLFALFDA
jgi:hypothetical protein